LGFELWVKRRKDDAGINNKFWDTGIKCWNGAMGGMSGIEGKWTDRLG